LDAEIQKMRAKHPGQEWSNPTLVALSPSVSTGGKVISGKIPLIAKARPSLAELPAGKRHNYLGENVAILSRFGIMDVPRAQSTTCR
jgi:hypothetical protein